MTQVVRKIDDWRKIRGQLGGVSLGFVPTMGALHEGHLELVKRSRAENERTLVSIFVNPTQFNDPSDLLNYPRTFESDLEKLGRGGADFLLYPDAEALYRDGYRYQVDESSLSRELCGAHRPGHFKGVLTVVMKLLGLAQATRAYFGEKDYQQLELVRGMADAFFLPTAIVACPTVREADGLAMSSRNLKLTPDERERAPALARTLRRARSAHEARSELERLGFTVDYVEDRLGRRFAAARLGAVRLIDNVEI
jgi:pantoate--beta-alanine ligase